MFHTTCFITENFLECIQIAIQQILGKVTLLYKLLRALKLNFWGCKEMISMKKC